MDNNEIFHNLTIKDNKKLKNLRLGFRMLVEECFSDLIKTEPVLMEKYKIQYYYFDNFELGTNIEEESINTLFVELKDTTQETNSQDMRKKSLQNIKNHLFNLLVSKSSKETLLWRTKNFIHYRYYEDFLKNTNNTEVKSEKVEDINKSLNNTDNDRKIYQFRIVVGENYKNTEKNLYGIRYYANNSNEVSIKYPKYAMEYYAYKNYITKNLYTEYVNLFKKIMLEEKAQEIKFELIETIIYNLPNNLFDKKITMNSIRNIINYLRNNPINNYKSLDNQSYAFLSQNTNLDIFELKHCIKTFENYYKRTNIN